MPPKRRNTQHRNRLKAGENVDGLDSTGMIREAAALLVADADDLKRLVILAAQRNPVLLRKLQLGFLNLYARERALEVEDGVDVGGQDLYDRAAAEAARLRRVQHLTSRSSPDDRPPRNHT